MGCYSDEFDEIELTEEEIAKLPARFRAYGYEYRGKFENALIAVTPPYLKFPFDDPKYHEYELTVWNKSNKSLDLDVDGPCSEIFKIFCRNIDEPLLGSTVLTLKVRCIPHDIRLATDCIRIKVAGYNVAPIVIPLELFPSESWFDLPRLIVVPSIPIGKRIEACITLPSPGPSEGKHYFIIRVLTELDCFSVTPLRGHIDRDEDNGRKIVITYTPMEYKTLVFTFHIIFPETPEFQPYEVNVYTRCVPNSESNAIRMATKEMEKLKLHPGNVKFYEPQLKFTSQKPRKQEDGHSNVDIFSPAGVVHFLLQKGGKLHENRSNVGPTGLSTAQERKIYYDKSQKFHAELNRAKIQQKNLAVQHSKNFCGEDSVYKGSEKWEEISKERDQQFMEYQKTMGLMENDPSDLSRTKFQGSNQRFVRDANIDYMKDIPIVENDEIHKNMAMNSLIAKKASQKRFIQAARVIITRHRASVRIIKLRQLIKETLEHRKRISTRSSRKISPQPSASSTKIKSSRISSHSTVMNPLQNT